MIFLQGEHHGRISIWEIKTGQCIRTIHSELDKIWDITTANDDKYIVASGHHYFLFIKFHSGELDRLVEEEHEVLCALGEKTEYIAMLCVNGCVSECVSLYQAHPDMKPVWQVQETYEGDSTDEERYRFKLQNEMKGIGNDNNTKNE